MLSVLFGGSRKAKIGILELDASLVERHEFENVVTAYPIEDGGEVTDHIYMKPDTVMVQGFVTNSPLPIFGTGLIPGVGAFNRFRTDRVGNALETLLLIRDKRLLVTVVTGLKVYKSMAMKRLTIPRNRSTGNAIQFTAEFVKVTKVSSESAEVPEENIADNQQDRDQASSPDDVGMQATPPASDAAKRSVLLNLVDIFTH